MRNNAKKVAFVANSAFTVLNFRRELICEMVSQGYIVLVVCPSACNLMLGRDVGVEITKLGAYFRPVHMERNGMNPFRDLLYLRNLYQLFKKEAPDYILNYTIKPTIYSSIAARMVGVGTICSNITGIGYALTSQNFKGKLIGVIVSKLYYFALRMNKLVFFQNSDDKELFVKKKFINSDKAVIINGSGIDTERFKRISQLPVGCSFVFVGRLLKDKGIFEFINAAKKVGVIYPEIQFSIVGPLDENPESLSERELKRLLGNSSIDYLGSVSDIRPYLDGHHVLVLPSYREGTPRVVLEAMSMSMPIITTDAPGCRETVIDGVNGYLAKVKDEKSLFDCIIKMIENSNCLEGMGYESRRIAETKYDVNIVNKKIISAFFGDK